MDTLPKDPVMLLSVVNTLLRDRYSSIDDLLSDLDADRESTVYALRQIGYIYDSDKNQFISTGN